VLNGTGANALYIAPIRSGIGTLNSLYYDSVTSEVLYDTSKTFVIQHPLAEDKYLVHACLEGPEAGVYYRGTGEIKGCDKYTTVYLPNYVNALAGEFTIHLTGIYDENDDKLKLYNSGKIINNEFKVYGEKGTFDWIVYGKRSNIYTEPLKKDTTVNGNGPYTWTTPFQKTL